MPSKYNSKFYLSDTVCNIIKYISFDSNSLKIRQLINNSLIKNI